MSKAKDLAQSIINQAEHLGWTIYVKGESILHIEKTFEPGNMDEFVKADCEWYSILGLMPTTSAGSTWGTDGSGVGAVSAHEEGLFIMNKSGCSKRVLNALKKMGC